MGNVDSLPTKTIDTMTVTLEMSPFS